MRVKFKSFKQPDKYGYSYDTDAWDTRAQVSASFQQFQTFGDGLTQHSREYPITRDYMGDYLASLAVAMQTDSELVNAVSYTLTSGPRAGYIAFAASVIYKDSDQWDKPRWFSLSEKKITTSKAKEHDKRYQRVQKEHDGSPEAIYSMVRAENCYNALGEYIYADAVRRWVFAQPSTAPHRHMDFPPIFLKWWEHKAEGSTDGWHSVRDECRFIQNALDICRNLIEAARLRGAAESVMSSLRYNWEQSQKAVERHAEQQAAPVLLIEAPAESVN